jgi:thymidylate synthase
MGIPELVWCIGDKEAQIRFGFPFNIASYATLAKILEEITLFVALGVEGNLKCVHFYDNQFEAVETLLKEILMCTKTAHWRFLKNSKTCVNCLEKIKSPRRII